MGLLDTNQTAKVGPYLEQAGAAGLEWSGILQKAITANPMSALELANIAVARKEEIDLGKQALLDSPHIIQYRAFDIWAGSLVVSGAVADMFVKASAIQQATAFLIGALQVRPPPT